MIIKLQNGNILKLSKEESDYLNWRKLSPEQKRQIRISKAKAYLNSGPNITNFWNALKAYFGGFNPKNPYLITGEAPNPGMRNPKLIIQGVLKAKSIAQKATKISDKVFDRLYFRAINSGNPKRVLAVRDLHFKAKTGNDLVLTTYRSLLSNERSKSQGLNPYNDSRHTVKHEGYFSTSSKDIANTYKVEEESPIFELYPYMKNPYVVDVNSRSWQAVELYHPEKFPHLTLGRTTDLVVRRVLSEGNNDGVIFRNIMDVGPKRVNLNGASEIADDYITLPGKAKLKDAITYDNYENIIPISQRDNFLINDIRYKQGGPLKPANARKWKHQKGGTLQNGAELGGLVGEAVKRVAKENAAKLWFESRYLPINWNNMKYIYNQMKLAGIPYDTTIAVMGNIIHESQGNPNKIQMGGGPGYGLIQWNKGTEPGDTLELQTQGIINTLTNPSGLNNYWYHGGEGSGFKSGEDVRLYMNRKNNYEFSRKTKAFSDSLLRPGKPEMEDRIKSARSLAALQDLFPEYLKGGII